MEREALLMKGRMDRELAMLGECVKGQDMNLRRTNGQKNANSLINGLLDGVANVIILRRKRIHLCVTMPRLYSRSVPSIV